MSDLDKLQGTWNVVSVELDGERLDRSASEGARIVLAGNRFTSATPASTS